MNITLVMVSSLNGKITKGTDPHIYSWTSKEDQEHFFSLLDKAECILMGRITYETSKEIMQHRPGRLRIIFTKNPQQYEKETIPDQLEFTSDSPHIAVEKLSQRGITNALLVSGSHVSAAFLKENLVNQLLLTLEPKIFGSGNPLFTEIAPTQGVFEKSLTLLSVEKLNPQGTLLLKYRLQ